MGFAESLTLWSLFASVLAMLVTATLALVVLVRLPADAFLADRRLPTRSAAQVLLRILTNAFGWGLIAAGLILSVPGVPGQGILTILVGLLLVEFPGRSRLLRKLLGRSGLRGRIDAIRKRFRRPPFQWRPD